MKTFKTKIEADRITTSTPKELELPKHDCPDYLLREQEKMMGDYLHLLEIRAQIEGVELD